MPAPTDMQMGAQAMKRGRAPSSPPDECEEDPGSSIGYNNSALLPRKRARISHGEGITSEAGGQSNSPLLDLPNELIYSIHVYAKNPAFAALNRRIHGVLKACPLSIKVQYLLARWHEAYCYGFHTLPAPVAETSTTFSSSIGRKRGATKGQSAATANTSPSLPSRPSADLLEGGALPELLWTSRMLPVLPVNEYPYPLSNSFQRSADHFILDYCLRYPLTTAKVLDAVEKYVLKTPAFGNIVHATGLWRDACTNVLHIHEVRARRQLDSDEAEWLVYASKPEHLRVTELPKRLFYCGEDEVGDKGCDDDMEVYRLARKFLRHTFGPGPLPKDASLALLLAVAAKHVPTAVGALDGAPPFNSFDGFPLAKAAFSHSMCFVQLLLTLGADPNKKAALALYIAIRTGWTEGVQTMVERDDTKCTEFRAAMEKIRTAYMRDGYAPGSSVSDALRHLCNTTNGALRHASLSECFDETEHSKARSAESGLSQDPPRTVHVPQKKRKLCDRLALDHKMLKEAVRYGRWDVANWLRSKGVIPDLRTIKLIEDMQMSGKIPNPSRTTASKY